MNSAIRVILITLLLTQAGLTQDWTFFGESPKAKLYIQPDNIERGQNSSMLWVKYVFSEEARRMFEANTGTAPRYSEEYIEIARSRRWRSHRLRLFDEKGLFYTRDQVKPWSPIESGKHLEPIWRLLYEGVDAQK